MHVARAALRDFRNYARADMELAPGLTIAFGPNGAGKTNLLEALYFALTARSCRTTAERELIRHGAGPARVAATVVGEDTAHRIEVALEPGQVKTVRVDGSPVATAADVRPPVTVFMPDRLELVKGAPARRRAHLDQFIAAAWPSRAAARLAYSRALGQRNALLARVRASRAGAAELDAWDGHLADAGAELVEHRAAAATELGSPFAARAAELGLPEAAELRYAARARDRAELVRGLAERRATDLERGFTTFGPHRDDLALVHGGRALRAYGSQGQQRLALLALLLAERDVLAASRRPPLMLLDDVMSELDRDRRERLVEAIASGGQAIVTATDREHVPRTRAVGAATLMVDAGQVRLEPHALAA